MHVHRRLRINRLEPRSAIFIGVSSYGNKDLTPIEQDHTAFGLFDAARVISGGRLLSSGVPITARTALYQEVLAACDTAEAVTAHRRAVFRQGDVVHITMDASAQTLRVLTPVMDYTMSIAAGATPNTSSAHHRLSAGSTTGAAAAAASGTLYAINNAALSPRPAPAGAGAGPAGLTDLAPQHARPLSAPLDADGAVERTARARVGSQPSDSGELMMGSVSWSLYVRLSHVGEEVESIGYSMEP